MGSLSIGHWLIVLLIVLLIFGTKKLRNMGGDLGGAIKNFKQSMKEGEAETREPAGRLAAGDETKADSTAHKKEDSKV